MECMPRPPGVSRAGLYPCPDFGHARLLETSVRTFSREKWQQQRHNLVESEPVVLDDDDSDGVVSMALNKLKVFILDVGTKVRTKMDL